MGGANTKAADGPPPISGVQVTEGLIRQLNGEPEPQPQMRSSRPVGPPWMPHLRPAFSSHASDRPSTTVSQEDAAPPPANSSTQHHSGRDDTEQAVQHERHHIQQSAAPAELKAEAASQQMVNQYADQLVKQYEAPLKALPCQDEKASCLICYQRNQQDPLQCAAQVDAFTKCARKASAIMVK